MCYINFYNFERKKYQKDTNHKFYILFCIAESSFNYFANIYQQTRKNVVQHNTCTYLDTPVPKTYRILDSILSRYQNIDEIYMKRIGTQLFAVLTSKIVCLENINILWK